MSDQGGGPWGGGGGQGPWGRGPAGGSLAGLEEKGMDAATGTVLVEIDPQYFRPTEVYRLRGDSTKAREKLGWHHKTRFADLVREMVAADLKTTAKENGLKTSTS
ncbi:MAG: GDP-mannose 4,6-dehydratase [Rhodospirillales bacterium]